MNKYFYCFSLFVLLPGYFIVYGQLNANFSASATSGCASFNVQFKDQSSGNPTSWYWDFGNGTNSNMQNPVTAYTNAGVYTVRLIIKNSTNKNYIEKKNYITVSPTPKAAFSQNIDNGCLPLSVSFNNTTNLFGAGIKNWSWNFGDGSTNGTQNPTHVYTIRGIYTVSLTAETNAGCIDSFTIAAAIKAGNKPANVSFKATPLDGCAGTLRNFTDLSSNNVNTWNWNFGDGGTSTQKKPSYHYTDTGFFSVKLVVSDNGCTDSIEYNNYIHVIGPVAKINKRVNCANPYTVNFYDQSKGAINRQWDFGDGVTSVLKNPSHTYNATGIYTAKLSVSANACIDTTNYTIYIINQSPSYIINPPKTIYCRNDSIEFIATNYDSASSLYFAWSFDSGLTRTPYNASASKIKNVYYKNGTYNAPILYIINKEYCVDTIQKIPLTITGPVASFTNSSPACLNNTINFLDQSTPLSQATNRQWNFGDGDSVIINASQTNYKYPFPGLYNVLFKITDINGCTDTISHTINVNDTPVINAGKDIALCLGKSVTLQPLGGNTYTWNNNTSLSCTNCKNPVATPADTTTFFVTGKNGAGCSSTDSIIVNVIKPTQLTVQPLNDTICAGNTVQLAASGYDFYKWQPVTGLNNPNIANPLASPLSNTVYTVTATDKAGCFSKSASVNIISNPKPSANIIDTNIITQPGALYPIKATYSTDVVKWQWVPAQWLNDTAIAEPTAQPLQTTTYTVYAYTLAGCVAVSHITINVVCNKTIVFIPNTFSPNNDGVNDYFFPRSNGSVSIKTLKIFNRWGNMVFSKNDFLSNDQSAGWDGRYKGEMQQADVYIYLIQSKCANGSVIPAEGSLTLIR